MVVAGTGSVGVIEEGDVIVAFEGRPVRSSSELVTLVRTQTPGQTVVVTAERAGEPLELTIVLGEHPTEEGVPIMGVEVVTPVSTYPPDALPGGEALEGRLVRAVALEDSIYLLDPVAGSWQDPGLASPEGGWAVVGDTAYTIVEGEEGVFIEEVGTGEGPELETTEWGVPTLVTGLGGLGVAIGRLLPEEGGQIETALLAIDPETGEEVWSWDPAQEGEAQSLALFAYANPARDEIVVLLGSTEGTGVTGHAIFDPSGAELTGWPDQGRFLPPAALVLGWFEDGSLLYVNQDGVGGLFAFDVTDRETSPVTITSDVGGASVLWPVGDARHIIGLSEDQLLLIDTVGAETRPLALGCGITSVGDPGGLAG